MSAGSTSTGCTVTWIPANNSGTDPDGWILGYKIYYNTLNSSKIQFVTVTDQNTTTATVQGLENFEVYEISVVAFNQYGEGNASEVRTCQTKEDGMHMAMPLRSSSKCFYTRFSQSFIIKMSFLRARLWVDFQLYLLKQVKVSV